MKLKRSLAIATLFLTTSSFAGEKLESHLARAVSTNTPDERLLVWVFFSDKGNQELRRPLSAGSLIAQRSLSRRQKVRSEENLVDYTDLPVEQSYVTQLEQLGVQIRHRSKWFNGVSLFATRNQISQIETLPFVRTMDLVWRSKREAEPIQETITTAPPLHRGSSPANLDYGQSIYQVNLINVPSVHNTGNYGQGVVIGVFDNGVRLLNHRTFDTLRTRLIATYDFVDHKVSVVPNDLRCVGVDCFGFHGVITLSALGGYTPGELIGPAFGAQYILARTENDSSETPIEEDNWVAAIEWADSIGVDVTSTSLGYLDYDPEGIGGPDWTWEDMNGNTTLITRAADMAVGKGIVVVNSAGNDGFNASHNTLNAPADGDSVLTIGAANTNGTRAGFSSVGPTTSIPPRIKPDVMAQGVAVRCASWTDSTQYIYSQGTSLACPLAAGVAALLLHAKPDATPIQVMNAIRSTANNANSPDNLVGWGLIDAVAAINYLIGNAGGLPTEFTLGNNFPNPFPTPSNPSTTISFSLSERSEVAIKVLNILGQEVRSLLNERRFRGTNSVVWDGKNNRGNDVASGVYICAVNATGVSGRSFTKALKISVIR